MNIIEYINTDISTDNGIDATFGYIQEYLDNLFKENGPLHLLSVYEEVFIKFNQCLAMYNIELTEIEKQKLEKQLTELNRMREVRARGQGGFSTRHSLFTDLQGITLHTYRMIKAVISEQAKNDIFNALLDHNISTKEELKLLLRNSIMLVEGNPTLPSKAKTQIIDHINSAIKEVESKTTNWSKFLGKVKQASILLTAVVAITGYSLKDLIQANDNIGKVIIVVEETTINNIIITNQLNINNNVQIGQGDDDKSNAKKR